MNTMRKLIILSLCTILILLTFGCNINKPDATKSIETTQTFDWKENTAKVISDNWEYTLKKEKDSITISQIQYTGTTNQELSLVIPSEFDELPVTCVGESREDLPEDAEFNKSLFGKVVEEPHDISGENDVTRKITQVILPDKLESIEPSAFSGLSNLREITLPSKLRNLGEDAFYDCKNLEKVTLSAKINAFSPSSFKDCDKLADIQIPKENPYLYSQDGLIITKDTNTLIYAIPAKEQVTIPNSVTNIGKGSLSSKNIKRINLNTAHPVFEKDEHCIYEKNTGKLVAVELAHDKLTISSSVTGIDGTSLCVGASKTVKKIILGENLKQVSADWLDVFPDCKKFEFKSSNPPKVVAPDKNTCAVPLLCTLYVPKNSIDKYKKWVSDEDANNLTTVKGL